MAWHGSSSKGPVLWTDSLCLGGGVRAVLALEFSPTCTSMFIDIYIYTEMYVYTYIYMYMQKYAQTNIRKWIRTRLATYTCLQKTCADTYIDTDSSILYMTYMYVGRWIGRYAGRSGR